MKDVYQFYPTPAALANAAWDMFKNKDFARVLEPSAGNGDLLEPIATNYGNRWRAQQYRTQVDVVEIDASKHPLLQSKGAKVVGYDFLDFTGINRYSHVIMNPPFAQGAQHLLHAWNGLYEGEIVCILNAETLLNAYSKERQHLLDIIQKHGRVEFVHQAFSDAERQTDVSIALVHLIKEAPSSELVGDLLAQLQQDENRMGDQLSMDFRQQLALPRGWVEDAVLRFDAAVLAAKQSAEAAARASFYERLLGKTFHQMNSKEIDAQAKEAEHIKNTPKVVRGLFAKAYDELKDRAWASVLRSTTVLSKLSSKAQKRLEAEFDQIKNLEFTAKNVYGFLVGLCESAQDIQEEMMLEVFDSITRYHEDNTVFYMGWKSNGKHRTAGMRLKTTRFILPGFGVSSWSTQLDFADQRLLADFDKVFAMLDGKSFDKVHGLQALFGDKESFKRLREGSREQCAYFEVRYYPKRGTIHFFPRSAELIDRLNRVVGKKRQWLPPNMEHANKDFCQQYEQAEKFDKQLREAFAAALESKPGRSLNNLPWALSQVISASHAVEPSDEQNIALSCMNQALSTVMTAHGWNPDCALSHATTKVPQLSLSFDENYILAA